MSAAPISVFEAFPEATIDQDNVSFYEGCLERELRFPKCTDCGKWHQPARSICPFCWSRNLVPTAVSGRGTVHLYIILRQGKPAVGVEYPYPVVTVELAEQEAFRFTSTIIDCDPMTVQLGTPVEIAWVDRAGTPFPVFRPAA